MRTSNSPTEGFLASFRSLASGLLGSVHDRLELFTLELEEEKLRVIQTLIWISAGIFVAMMSLGFFSLTVVYLVGETARPIALGGMTVLYLLLLGTIVLGFRPHLARQSKPFAGTLNELRQDCACIRTRS